MEFLIIIGAIWFISYLYQQHKEKQAQEEIERLIEAMAEERRQNVFKSKVESKKIDGDEFDWDVFQVNIKGIIDGLAYKSVNLCILYGYFLKSFGGLVKKWTSYFFIKIDHISCTTDLAPPRPGNPDIVIQILSFIATAL